MERSEAVLKLGKELAGLQVAATDPWSMEYRLFMMAGLAIEALGAQLEAREAQGELKSGELPSGWPGRKKSAG